MVYSLFNLHYVSVPQMENNTTWDVLNFSSYNQRYTIIEYRFPNPQKITGMVPSGFAGIVRLTIFPALGLKKLSLTNQPKSSRPQATLPHFHISTLPQFLIPRTSPSPETQSSPPHSPSGHGWCNLRSRHTSL